MLCVRGRRRGAYGHARRKAAGGAASFSTRSVVQSRTQLLLWGTHRTALCKLLATPLREQQQQPHPRFSNSGATIEQTVPYPTSPTTGGQTSIWNHVGGRVGDNGNSGNFVSSSFDCMRQALNASGFKILMRQGTRFGRNADLYFSMTGFLQLFLIKNFGKPKEYSANSWRGQLAGKTGPDLIRILRSWV